MTDLRIAYCFADYGVEAEALSTVGEVHRFTIDPKPNPYCHRTVEMDLLEEQPDGEYNLFVGHPKCTKFSDMTSISGSSDDHEDQIPRAREIATTIADEYVIENKPRAWNDKEPDPTVLQGDMFGLPIHYKRGFETSFEVGKPTFQTSLSTEVSPYYYSDRSKEWWRVVKGYNGKYPKQHLAKNALPRAYVQHLLAAFLRATNDRDMQPARSGGNDDR